MAEDRDESDGGFSWGLVVGLALGVAADAFLARGPARKRMDELRARTIEIKIRSSDFRTMGYRRQSAGDGRSATL